jgi:type I restriction enzyme S subunit
MISELVKVPTGWEKVRFGEIAKNVTDRIDNPKESDLKDYIGLEHLDTDEIRIKRYGSPDEVEATKLICKKGDIIFGKRRAYLRKLSITSRDAVVSAHSMVLRAKEEKVLPNFLPWFMQSTQFWKTAFAISEGSLSPTIKWKTLANQEFWLPSREEQGKISILLWSIQENIDKTEKLIEATEKLKRGLLEELLTKGIGHKKFKKSELGEIPEEWECKTLFEAARNREEAVQTGPFGAQLHSYDYVETGVPLILIRNIENNEIVSENTPFITEEKARQLGRYRILPGDIVFSRVADVGRAAVAENEHSGWMISGQLLRVRLDNPSIRNDFVKFVIKTSRFKEILTAKTVGSTRDSINTTILGEMPIVIPSLQEQDKICKILNDVDSIIILHRRHLLVMNLLRKKLMNSMLSGELLLSKEEVS